MPEIETSRVLFMRHPETVSNVQHWYSGVKDVYLSPAGDAQRRRAIDALVCWKPDHIFCSPLSRCLSIAAVAAEHLGIEVVIDDRLAEINFGVIEGVDYDEIADMGYRFPWPFGVDGLSRPCPGGESFEDFVARAQSMLDTLKGVEGRVACVTHGGFMRAALAAAYTSSLEEFYHMKIGNVASMVMTCDGNEFSLAAFGLTPAEVRNRLGDPDVYNADSSRGEFA